MRPQHPVAPEWRWRHTPNATTFLQCRGVLGWGRPAQEEANELWAVSMWCHFEVQEPAAGMDPTVLTIVHVLTVQCAFAARLLTALRGIRNLD